MQTYIVLNKCRFFTGGKLMLDNKLLADEDSV